MTMRNFQHLVESSDMNGALDIDEVVAIKYAESFDTIIHEKLPTAFKRKAILPYLEYTFIVYFDKHGNGYSRIIF